MTNGRTDENKETFAGGGARRGAESFGVEPRPKVEPTLLRELRSAESLRSTSLEDLERLALEIRSTICDLAERRGVHFASNLGVVELAIALHSTFDFRRDRLVWDVGHQCYPHKLLTGRFAEFGGIRTRGGLSGYPDPEESEYDLFRTGHAGCSVGTALGLARGDELAARLNGGETALKAEKSGKPEEPDAPRYSVAVVGDGALAGGPIFEALNHAGGLRQKMLVVLNDNKMSICQRVGGLGRSLDKMRTAPTYLGARTAFRRFFKEKPGAYRFLTRLRDAAKAGLVGGMLFEDFGFRYVGPIDGHDLATLRKYLERIKTIDEPVLLHVLTEKGRGYRPAEIDPASFHATSPEQALNAESVVLLDQWADDELKTSKSRRATNPKKARANALDAAVAAAPDAARVVDLLDAANDGKERSFTDWARCAIYRAMKRDPRVCVVVAAMTQGNMLEAARAEFPDRFFDVGICEAHAVNFAAGLAKAGMRPIVDIYSGFLQRAYDHLFQEASLQNLPIIFAIDRAGLVGADGPTHHGVFDLSYLRPFPNITTIAPGDACDMARAFEFALTLDGPTAIRYPKTKAARIRREVAPFELGRAEVLRDGTDGAFVVCGGGILKTALDLAEDFARGAVPGRPVLDVGVVNARFVKPLDRDRVLRPLREGIPTVVVEENALAGGFTSAVLEAANDEGLDARFLLRKGVPDAFIPCGSRDEQLADVGLDRAGMLAAFDEVRARVARLTGASGAAKGEQSAKGTTETDGVIVKIDKVGAR
ncbi:MAG: 1-deoxy-D-xylulose-5-phosphate synthase [Thermoguttaceae bacterium]|nr:1-deoxy-D-xylulose-5-phosphate synthase [Thermoguttaceae bacterium]